MCELVLILITNQDYMVTFYHCTESFPLWLSHHLQTASWVVCRLHGKVLQLICEPGCGDHGYTPQIRPVTEYDMSPVLWSQILVIPGPLQASLEMSLVHQGVCLVVSCYDNQLDSIGCTLAFWIRVHLWDFATVLSRIRLT